MLLFSTAHAEEPPSLKPLALKLSSGAVVLDADVPDGWQRTPPPGRKTPVVGRFSSRDGKATVTVRHLAATSQTPLQQAQVACDFYAQYGKVVIEPMTLPDGRAVCGIRSDTGDRLRVYVVHLGPESETQLLVLTSAFSGTRPKTLRQLGRIVDSLRLTRSAR